MAFYEVLVADIRYRGGPLVYSYSQKLAPRTFVTVPLRGRRVSALIQNSTTRPVFEVKKIIAVTSPVPLPKYSLKLAHWLSNYSGVSLGEALAQYAPAKPTIRHIAGTFAAIPSPKLSLMDPLTPDQKKAVATVETGQQTTYILHGQTGSGKTRVYLELAKMALAKGRSAIILTPEISLVSQLEESAKQLGCEVFVLHSRLSAKQRKNIWLKILESTNSAVVIGPRSALFAPVDRLGLVILDEAHEPAYKQDQTPRYNTIRVASALGKLSGSKVILGTATPLVTDFYLGKQRNAVVTMTQPAMGHQYKPATIELIDLRDKTNTPTSPYLSKQLISAVGNALKEGKQSMVYLNRRGSARLTLCRNCGWQALCPNCDIPLVYHSDSHHLVCHTCYHQDIPPKNCPDCGNPDIIYRGIGTKALYTELEKMFPHAHMARFDSDNKTGEHLYERYQDLRSGKLNLIVGTQLLAKGLDLPKLAVVGVISADSSLALPDFSSEERAFQLLYQVMGRVGRGHGEGKVIIQTYQPNNPAVNLAYKRDYESFYKYTLNERKNFNFPPYVHLLKLTCQRSTDKSAKAAADKLSTFITQKKIPVLILGPAPSFWGRRSGRYNWQIIVKSKDRKHLLSIVTTLPSGWTFDLDPQNLL